MNCFLYVPIALHGCGENIYVEHGVAAELHDETEGINPAEGPFFPLH